MSRSYKFKAVLNSNKLIRLKKDEIKIEDKNIKFVFDKSQNNIIVYFCISAKDEIEAKRLAEQFLECLCMAILIRTNIVISIESIQLVKKPEISKLGTDTMNNLTISEKVGLRDSIRSITILEKSSIEEIIEFTEKLKNLKNELIKRLLRWYGWALSEGDAVDKFIKLWIAFEIWAQYMRYKSGNKSEKIKMTQALRKICGMNKNEADEMYTIRCTLFHSGKLNKKLREKNSKLENCFVSNIISSLRKSIQN